MVNTIIDGIRFVGTATVTYSNMINTLIQLRVFRNLLETLKEPPEVLVCLRFSKMFQAKLINSLEVQLGFVGDSVARHLMPRLRFEFCQKFIGCLFGKATTFRGFQLFIYHFGPACSAD